MIHQVESVEEFNQLINTTKYKATIVDFTATWLNILYFIFIYLLKI